MVRRPTHSTDARGPRRCSWHAARPSGRRSIALGWRSGTK
jgi:hypothetical protein